MSTLLSLPVEVLMEIVGHLGPSQSMIHGPDSSYRTRSCLLHLAQTCRTFRDLCLPVLYKVVNIRFQPVQLIQSLVLSPTNASYISKVIICNGEPTEQEWNFTTAQEQFINDTLQTRLADPYRNSSALRLSGTKTRTQYRSAARTFGTLLLLLAPNVETMAVASDRGFHNYRCGSYPRLRTVSFHYPPVASSNDMREIDGLLRIAPNIQHVVAGGICRVVGMSSHKSVTELCLTRSSLTPAGFHDLVKVFPNLHSLSYEAYGKRPVGHCDGDLSSTLLGYISTLRKLVLHYMTDDYHMVKYRLAEIYQIELLETRPMEKLAAMEVLETIEIHASYLYPGYKNHAIYRQDLMQDITEESDYYTSGLPNAVRLRAQQEATQRQCTIRSMLQLGDIDSRDRPDEKDDEVDNKITQLYKLPAIYRLHKTNEFTDRLVSFLPKSIKRLILIDPPYEAFYDLIELGLAAPNLFPNLREIHLPRSNNMFSICSILFTRQGIITSTSPRNVSEFVL